MKAFMLCVSFLSRRSATKARGAHSSVDVDDRAALDFTSEDARGDVRHLRQRSERRGPCQLSKVEIERKPRPGFEAHQLPRVHGVASGARPRTVPAKGCSVILTLRRPIL